MPGVTIDILIIVAVIVGTNSIAPASDPWADTVVDASPSMNGSGLYNNPHSVLGSPTRSFYDPFVQAQYMTSLVVPAIYLDGPDGNKVVTTINRGEFVKVRFDEPVEDDPDNTYGIDLLVFGNSFLISDGRVIGPDEGMETVPLVGAIFSEPVTVAVSQTGVGNPQSHPRKWYVYEQGPYADDLFPTNAFTWNRCTHDWGTALNFTKPVDPGLTVDDFQGLMAADGVDLYGASGGGTGFDLTESRFDWIQYVYLTSKGGEVDALADVSPGDIAPGDLDLDGDVDLHDFVLFQCCYTGSGGGPAVCECRRADLDQDEDVDLTDFGLFTIELTGPR